MLGTSIFFTGIMDISGSKKDILVSVIEADKAARIDPVTIAWDYDESPPMVELLRNGYGTVINEYLGIE